MIASAEGKQQKWGWQLPSSGTVYWSYPIIITFRDCRVHIFFLQPFSK